MLVKAKWNVKDATGWHSAGEVFNTEDNLGDAVEVIEAPRKAVVKAPMEEPAPEPVKAPVEEPTPEPVKAPVEEPAPEPVKAQTVKSTTRRKVSK